MNNECWIPVSTSDGMFSEERAISLRLADGSEVSFFVDTTQLRREVDGHGELRVVLVDTDSHARRQRVLLPTETFETATRWVEVAV
jgi:hypothetical protein